MAKPQDEKETQTPEKKPILELNSNSVTVLVNIVTIAIIVISMLTMYIALETSFNKKISRLLPQDEQTETEEGDEPLQEGVLLDLGEFILNLADSTSRRYLKAGVAIELSKTEEELLDNSTGSKSAHGGGLSDNENAAIIQEMERYKPAIRDAIISVLSNKTSDELSTPTGKEIAKEEITEIINNIFEGQREVMRISFGQFVIQ